MDEEPPIALPLKFEPDMTITNASAMPSENVTINKSTRQTLIPKSTEVNILNIPRNIDAIYARLEQCSIIVITVLYNLYNDGTMTAALFYCKTTYGHYLFVEPPPDVVIPAGDLAVMGNRVGFLSKDVTNYFNESLKTTHTGYAFICRNGIQLLTDVGRSITNFIYGDLALAKTLFETKKHHYILVPSVSLSRLAEQERFNTLEVYINHVDKGKIMKELIEKAGLVKLLTVKTPLTLFMPTDEKLATLRGLDQINLLPKLLAHFVVGRVDSIENDKVIPPKTNSTLTDSSQSSQYIETTAVNAISQNSIAVTKDKGIVTEVKSGDVRAKVLQSISGNGDNRLDDRARGLEFGMPTDLQLNAPSEGYEKNRSNVSRFNGVIYRIDSILKPVAENFRMPASSDLDDLVTVFDITKSTMEIRRAEYKLNYEKQRTALETIESVYKMYGELRTEIMDRSKSDGSELLKRSNQLHQLLYEEDVPCKTRCQDLVNLQYDLMDRNHEFEILLRVSNKLASLKFAAEKLMHQLSKIDQKLHVKNPVSNIVDLDDSDNEA